MYFMNFFNFEHYDWIKNILFICKNELNKIQLFRLALYHNPDSSYDDVHRISEVLTLSVYSSAPDQIYFVSHQDGGSGPEQVVVLQSAKLVLCSLETSLIYYWVHHYVGVCRRRTTIHFPLETNVMKLIEKCHSNAVIKYNKRLAGKFWCLDRQHSVVPRC